MLRRRDWVGGTGPAVEAPSVDPPNPGRPDCVTVGAGPIGAVPEFAAAGCDAAPEVVLPKVGNEIDVA